VEDNGARRDRGCETSAAARHTTGSQRWTLTVDAIVACQRPSKSLLHSDGAAAVGKFYIDGLQRP